MRLKSIGHGPTSEVFMISRDELLALKVYYSDSLIVTKGDSDYEEEEEKPLIDADNARRFLREYENINALSHPNIIKVFGINFGDTTHPPSILLEYCPSNLKKKIKKLTDLERIGAIVDLSNAMKEIHSIGIIHRDFKLENILLDDQNKIKVSDFCLYTLIDVEAETKSRMKLKALELLLERTDYDQKVNVYSFGVVVFMILTKGDFPDISVTDFGNGKKAKIPSSISDFSKYLIDKCWSFKASDRPSFAEICELLKGNKKKLI